MKAKNAGGDVTAAVVRIFGTNDRYGDAPRTRPPGLPLVFDGLPEPGVSVRVDLGPVPAEHIEAERVRRAIGRVMLWGLAGVHADLDTQGRLDKAYQEVTVSDLTDEFNWYTTILLARPVEVKQRTDVDLDVLFPEEPWELEETSVEYAKTVLDVVASIVSAIVDIGIFEKLVVDDRVHLLVEGRRPSGIPVVSGSGSANITRGGEATALLGQRVALLSEQAERTRTPRQCPFPPGESGSAAAIVEPRRHLRPFAVL